MLTTLSARASAYLLAVVLALLVATGGHTQPPEKDLPYDYSQVKDSYTNFLHLTQTPEELFFDFGTNVNHPAAPKEKVKMSQRVAMNYYTAKRMHLLLTQALERHEKTFGPIEPDVQKRVKNPKIDPPAAE